MAKRFRKTCLDSYAFRGRGERSQGFVFPGNVWSGGPFVPPQLPLVLTDSWNYPQGTSLDAQPNWQGTGSSSAWLVQNQQFIFVNGGNIPSQGDVVTTSTGVVETNKPHNMLFSGQVLVNCSMQITLDWNQTSETTFNITNNGAGLNGQLRLIGGGVGSDPEVDLAVPGASPGSMIITSAFAEISAPNPANGNKRTAKFTVNIGGTKYVVSKGVGVVQAATLATIAIAWSNPVGGNLGKIVCECGPITVRGYTS